MEARVEKRNAAQPSKVETFFAKLNSPEQMEIMKEVDHLTAQFRSYSDDQLGVAGEKYITLLVILNRGRDQLFDLDTKPLIELYLPFLLTNQLEIMQKGFEIAQEQGKANLESNLLQICSVSANVDNFNAMCMRLGLVIMSEAYPAAMMQKNSNLPVPIAPLYMAAFSGNLNLLRDICGKLGRYALTELEEYSGLTLMHFAAMGGDVDMIDYLHRELRLPLEQPSSKGVMPFAYTALSNHPAAVRKFLDLGYKPTNDDISHYNNLYSNDITELRKGFAKANPSKPAHEMPYVLREEMGDPLIKAVKAARQAIDQQVQSTLGLLNEMLQIARYDQVDLQEMCALVRETIDAMRQEIQSYSPLTGGDESFAKSYRDALRQLDTKEEESLQVIGEIRARGRAHLRSPEPSPSTPSPSPSPSPSLSSTSRMLSDIEWQRRMEENVARTRDEMEKEERKETSLPRLAVDKSHVDMLELRFEDFVLTDEELDDFASEKEEKSPRFSL